MTNQRAAVDRLARDIFPRKVVDVREVFRESLDRYLVEGKVADKEKLEQDKLKISASLVNFVVTGGVLLFREEASPAGEGAGKEAAGAGHPAAAAGKSATGEVGMDEAAIFHLLLKTIVLMLKELNAPDVNLLKISLAKSFRETLQSIFSEETAGEPDRFPVKIFQDKHPDHRIFIGINLRNTRSLGEDIDRIERDTALRKEIVGCVRPTRHSDRNLLKMFSPPINP